MRFYVTTPLYYVNDTPHIGHAYTTVVADVLNRYHKLFGHETFFLTGTDEHGQKVQAAAQKKGLDEQLYVDEVVQQFKDIWKILNIEADFFIRTTDSFHKKVVQDCLQKLYDRGEIYAQDYEGWYSVSEEIFYTEKELVNGKSPTGNDVQRVTEKNYFFKMSQYQQRLIEYIEAHPDFIQPAIRRNEVLGFLKQPLNDLCISRPKNRLRWGIEIPFDTNYVTYVWFDALLNYASAVGFEQPGTTREKLMKFWPDVHHIIGKDILITHSIYWTTMLMALNLPMPKTIFAHGWWLTEQNEKMSKSKGLVVKPLDMKDVVGIDGLRYFLTRDIHFGNDAQFSQDLVISRVNSELSNNLGNLSSRTTNLIHKYFNGEAPKLTLNLPESLSLKKTIEGTPEKVKEKILKLEPNLALGHIVEMLTEANRYLEVTAPWKSAASDLAHAGEALALALESLRVAGILLQPVMPTKMETLLTAFDVAQEKRSFNDAKSFGEISHGQKIQKMEPLFPRIQESKP